MNLLRYKVFFYIFFVIFCDQIIKFIIFNNLTLNEICRIKHFGSFFNICYVINSGLAFNLFSDYRYIKVFIVFFRVLVIFLLLARFYNAFGRHSCVGIGFICGGGISNTVDLFIYSGVIDMFYFDFINISGDDFFYNISFNLADVFILVGLILCWVRAKGTNVQ